MSEQTMEVVRMTGKQVAEIQRLIDGKRLAVESLFPRLRGRRWYRIDNRLYVYDDTPANRANAAEQSPKDVTVREVIHMQDRHMAAIGDRIEHGRTEREAVEVQFPRLRGRLWFQEGTRIIVEPNTRANCEAAADLQATRDAIDRSAERDAAGFGTVVKDVPWYKPELDIECGCVTDSQSCPACRAAAFANYMSFTNTDLMDFSERYTEMARCSYGHIGIPGQIAACPPIALKIAHTRVAEWLAERLPRETLQEAAGLAYEQHADRLVASEGTDVRTNWTEMHGGIA